jgi:hypothetical protein
MKSIGISAALYLWNAMRRVEAAGGVERSDCDSDLLMLMRILEVKEVMHCCGEVRGEIEGQGPTAGGLSRRVLSI